MACLTDEVVRQGFKAHNSDAAVRGVVESATAKHAVRFAAALLPHKIAFAWSPKAGSTTTEWVMLALLGNAPSAACELETAWKLDSHKEYDGAVPLNELNSSLIEEIFTSEEWVTIAVVRDPWTRAISSYLDQIKRNKVNYDPSSIDDFLDFVEHYTLHAVHFGLQSINGGLSYLRYDYYVDIECLPELGAILDVHRPHLVPYLTQGWENCTHEASLIHSAGANTHHYDNNGLDKAHRMDLTYCSPRTTAAVSARFRRDYEALNDLAGLNYSDPHACLT